MPSRKCVVIGCTTSYSDTVTIRHRFPKDDNTFKIWVIRSGNNKLLNMSMADVHKSFLMCNKHFAPNCKSPGFKKLIMNSVPTLNLPEAIDDNNDAPDMNMSIEVVTLNTSQMSAVVDGTPGSNSESNKAEANNVLDLINMSVEIILPEADMDLQHNTGLGRFKTVFTQNQELELVEYIKTMEARLFDLTSLDLRSLAYQLAVKNNISHTFCKDGLAEVDWLYGFMKQHSDLSLRQPEPTSAARASGFNKIAVRNTSNLINSGGHAIKFVHPQQNVQQIYTSIPLLTPQVITQPTIENVQDRFRVPTVPLVDEQEKLLLANQPPGTVIKCITAQVIQSPTHGRQIILKGIRSDDFTPQKLQFIKQQIKQKLLKAQESNGTQEVLGPTKIYLVIQPPDPRVLLYRKPGLL